MVKQYWKLVLNFGADLEYSSSLCKFDVCPCRYCWSGKCGMKFLQISNPSPLPTPSSEATDFSQPPKWKLTLIADDGSEVSSDLFNSENCPCGQCWCGKKVTGKLQNSDRDPPTLWIFSPSNTVDSTGEYLFETEPSETRQMTPPKRLNTDSPDASNEKPTAEAECDGFHPEPKSLRQPSSTPSSSDNGLHSNIEPSNDTGKQLTLKTMQLPIKCCICPARFKTTAAKRDHQKRHKERGRFKCIHCPFTSEYLFSIHRHVSTHTGEKPYKCDKCHMSFRRMHSMKLHRIKHTGRRNLKCCVCPNQFETRRERSNHQKTHRNENGRYQCPQCGRSYSHMFNLLKHISIHPKLSTAVRSGFEDSAQSSLSKRIEHGEGTVVEKRSSFAERIRFNSTSFPGSAKIASFHTQKGALLPNKEASAIASSRKFTCWVCSCVFDNRAALNQHLKNHKQPFQCCMCLSKFQTNSQRRIHFLQHKNSETGRYHCSQCKYTSVYAHNMPPHMRVHSGEKPYKCNTCSRAFSSSMGYMKHKQTCIQDSVTSWKSATEFSELSRIESHSVNQPPNDCDSSATDASISVLPPEKIEPVNTDESTTTPLLSPECNQIQPFSCSLCESIFSTKKQQSVHVIQKHQDDDGRFKCNDCDVSCTQIETMVKHRESHQQKRETETIYKCALCREPFTNLNELARHDAKVHIIRRREKQHQCNQCPKSFKCKTNLNRHKQIHSGYRPYKCDHCSKAFKQQVHLQGHRRIHTGEKPYKCDQCSLSFITSSKRNIHNKIRHTGRERKLNPASSPLTDFEKPHPHAISSYKCGTNAEQAQVDLMPNVNRKLFHCGQCSAKFREKSNLRKHIRIAHFNRPGSKSSKLISVPVTELKSRELDLGDVAKDDESSIGKANSHVLSNDAHVNDVSLSAKWNRMGPQTKNVRIQGIDKKHSHKCEFCAKVLSRRDHLREHTMIHTGERPFKCSKCSKAFIKSSDLTRHGLTHSGEKPFKCNRCSKTFNRRSTMYSHMTKRHKAVSS